MTAGALWPTLFRGDEDNIRKILYQSWLIRDWDFANTSLTGFSPFNPSDGNLITTLFSSSNPGGAWNDVGYLGAKGPQFTPKLQTKTVMTAQSRWPARYDYTGQSEEIGATLLESNPVVDALLNNQALSTLQEVGAPGYASSAPVELDLRWRQAMFIGVDGRSGRNYYTVRLYPKVLITDFGNVPWNVDDAAGLPIKAVCIPDDYSIPPANPDGTINTGSPRWILRDGPGWRLQGESDFEIGFPTPPVAAPVTGLKATVAFNTPAGLINPVTYTALKQTGGTGAFSSATITGSPTVSGNTTTITISGLTASTQYAFEVVATDSATPTPTVITSAPSNSITSTAS